MKVYMVGSLDPKSLSEIRGKPAVVLTGTKEEVRAAALFLFKGEVAVVAKPDEERGE